MATNFKTCRPPLELFLVHDPLDGPHLFRSFIEAEKEMKKWEREAKDCFYDSFWDMSGPYRYKLVDEEVKYSMMKED